VRDALTLTVLGDKDRVNREAEGASGSDAHTRVLIPLPEVSTR
jgi:hypothetical protein